MKIYGNLILLTIAETRYKKMGKDYTQSSKIIKKYLFQLFLMVCNVFDIKFGSSLSCHIDIFDILKNL